MPTQPYEKPKTPEGMKVPGLQWRRRTTGQWVAYWVPTDALARGSFPIKSRRLWASSPGQVGPTEDDWRSIASRCASLHGEMLAWLSGQDVGFSEPNYDGTFASLIRIYQTDDESPYKQLRYRTAVAYDSRLDVLTAALGGLRVAAMSFRDIKRHYRAMRSPASPGGADRVSRAHGLMVMLRAVVSFGCLLEIEDCARMTGILSGMDFEMPKRRTDFLTASQVSAFRVKARELGYPSLALATAFQFECMFRQKDVIGELIPQSEPGISEIVMGAMKWMHGLRWDQIDDKLILIKRISKSLRGRSATMRVGAGRTEAYDLKSYPMIMDELLRYDRLRVGPVIIRESTGLPWPVAAFQVKWRMVARAAGIPDGVQSRDSRAGGITEATDAGADLDSVRRHAGHTQPSMTARYSRTSVDSKNAVAATRAASRRTPRERP